MDTDNTAPHSIDELVDRTLLPHFDSSSAGWEQIQEPSLLRLLMTAVYSAAASEEQQAAGVGIIWRLVGCTHKWNSPSKQMLEFWRHDDKLLQTTLSDGKPHIARESLESSVGDYLDLPYRVREVERVMVDMLVAAEFSSYVHQMVRRPSEHWIGLSPSPLHQPHVVLQYIKANALVALVCGGILCASIWLLPTEIGRWVSTAAIVLWILGGLAITFVLPPAWRHQRRQRKDTWRLVKLMGATYDELSTTLQSTRRIREVAAKAADGGVVWPSGLMALLDDNISRLGRI